MTGARGRQSRLPFGLAARRSILLLAGISLAVLVLVLLRSRAASVTTAPLPRTPKASRLESPVPLPAARPASIAGRIVDPGGRGHAGAVVALVRSGNPGDDDEPLLARAGEGGGFQFDAPGPGTYGLTATAVGLGAAVIEGLVLLPGQALETVELVLSSADSRVFGTVRDSGSGVIEGAAVLASKPGGGSSAVFATLSDRRGGFSLSLTAGTYLMAAHGDGYASDEKSVALSTDREVDFVLNPAASISGRVVRDVDSQPVADAVVSAYQRPPQHALWLGNQRRARTGVDGAFEVRNLDPGEYRVFAARGNLAGRLEGQVSLGLAERKTVVVRVGNRPQISGRVSDSEGQPVVGAEVGLRLVEPQASSGLTASTDASGGFLFEAVLPGSYGLVARSREHAPARRILQVAEEDLRVDLVLESGAQLEGKAISSTGEAVEGAAVQAQVVAANRLGGEVVDFTTSSNEGAFRLSRIPADEVRVIASHPDFGQAWSEPMWLEQGSRHQIVLTFQDSATVSGTVRRSDGRPAARAAVSALPLAQERGSERIETVTGADGRYRVGPLGKGKVALHAMSEVVAASGNTVLKATQVIELENGEQRSGVDFVLPETHRIQGVVVDPNGDPVLGAIVDVAKSLRDPRQGSFTDGEGRFAVEDLPKDVFTVSAWHPDFPVARADRVPVDTDVRLQFRRASAISGTAIDGSGARVADYAVGLRARSSSVVDDLLQRSPFGPLQARAVDGAFQLANVPAGTYELLLITSDGRAGRIDELHLEEGQQLSVGAVRLAAGASIRGTVVEAGTATPISSAWVGVLGLPEPRAVGTEGSGKFELQGLPGGVSLQLIVFDRERRYESREVPVTAPGGGEVADLGAIEMHRLPR